MKIAINCSFFNPRSGGIKEYIYNLVSNLSILDKKNSYILYVASDCFEYAKQELPSEMLIKVTPFSSKNPIKRSILERKFFLQEEETEQFDIFHSPFFHSPRLIKSKIILTVHDLRLYRYPKTYSFLRLCFLRYAVRKSIKRCDHIIAISQFTKDEILDVFKIEKKKVSVVHEAVNKNYFTKDEVLNYDNPLLSIFQNKRFLLTVGHLEPRKNYERLLMAFEQLKKDKTNDDLKLVVVGKTAHSTKKVLDMINSNPDVHYLDFVEHKLLIWLYLNANLFVFPSIYEGFGFPPLEAATLNVVSTVSNCSSIPEVCGDSAFYFNPFDVNSISEVIDVALNDRSAYKDKQLKLDSNLNRFSWIKNASDTLNLYNKLKHNSI
ncbi:MAG: glycosyltransferase family 4 protein [Dysgonomonas sp.]